jgi:hypothetical protein
MVNQWSLEFMNIKLEKLEIGNDDLKSVIILFMKLNPPHSGVDQGNMVIVLTSGDRDSGIS